MEVLKVLVNDEDRYKFPVYKTVKARDGNDVEILDREDVHTLGNLEEQKKVYQDMILVIDAKIEAINNLK